jgi:ArsR family transcriptional regulator
MAIPVRQLASEPAIQRLARTFHALSDETRLRIVAKLLTGEQCVCDLMETLAAAQSRLSFHMKILKQAGLVTDRRHGRWIHYSIVPETVHEIRSVIANVADEAARVPSSKCCG